MTDLPLAGARVFGLCTGYVGPVLGKNRANLGAEGLRWERSHL